MNKLETIAAEMRLGADAVRPGGRRRGMTRSPILKPCPFCGRKAVYMGYDLHDPISGKPRSRVMIGCPAAFTARGDWGDDHKACPVAPMIDSWAAPAGTDIVAAWNRRAGKEARDGQA